MKVIRSSVLERCPHRSEIQSVALTEMPSTLILDITHYLVLYFIACVVSDASCVITDR